MKIGFAGLISLLARGIHSDHSSSLISLFEPSKKFKGPFKFCNTWMKHPDFKKMLDEHWNVTDGMQRKQGELATKLGKFQPVLKNLNLKNFSFLGDKAEAARRVLDEAQERCDEEPFNAVLKDLEIKARKNSIFLHEAERSFLSQKAKNRLLMIWILLLMIR